LVNGTLDEGRVRDVVRRVIEARLRDRQATLAHFARLVKLELRRHVATVEMATALPPDLQQSIAAELLGRYGPALRTTFTLRPELIGGVRIQVGSDLYDGSVRAGLAALANSL